MLIGDVPQDLVEFERQVKVKSFLRNGKVVKAHQRTDKRKKKPVGKIAGGVAAGAMVLGVPVATFAAMKFRYIKGFPKSARYARALSRKAKVADIGDDINHVTFTLGGITPKAKEGRLIAQSLKKRLKGHHFVPYDNKLYKSVTGGISPFRELMTTSFRLGRNPDAIEVAAQAYAYHRKYPGKQLNFVGHSAGGMIGKEAANILELLGVPKSQIKVVTTGTPDLGFIKHREGDLNIFAPDDPLRIFAPRNAKMSSRNQKGLKFKEHFVLTYFRPGKHSQKASGILDDIEKHLNAAPPSYAPVKDFKTDAEAQKDVLDQIKAIQREIEENRRRGVNYRADTDLIRFARPKGAKDKKPRKRRSAIGATIAIGAPAIAGASGALYGARRFTRSMLGKEGENLPKKELDRLRKAGTEQYVDEWTRALKRADGPAFGHKKAKIAAARGLGWAMKNPALAGAIAGGAIGAAGYGTYRGIRKRWKRRKS